jgi:hypothetical protein
MIIVLVIAVWIALLSLVAALCAAAQVGDRGRAASARWEDARSRPWEAAEGIELSSRASFAPECTILANRAAESGAAALQSGGVAA